MKKQSVLFVSLAVCMALSSCAPNASSSSVTADSPASSSTSSSNVPDGSTSVSLPSETKPGKQDSIPFADGQSYAVAHVGYQQIEDLDYYVTQYLESGALPIHYLSSGDYYLVIPRYEGMALSLYKNDFETSAPILLYEEPNCRPFLIQCNVSDIFPDATIQLTYHGEVVSFSPFISLKDGSLDVGEHGLNLTRDATAETQN